MAKLKVKTIKMEVEELECKNNLISKILDAGQKFDV